MNQTIIDYHGREWIFNFDDVFDTTEEGSFVPACNIKWIENYIERNHLTSRYETWYMEHWKPGEALPFDCELILLADSVGYGYAVCLDARNEKIYQLGKRFQALDDFCLFDEELCMEMQDEMLMEELARVEDELYLHLCRKHDGWDYWWFSPDERLKDPNQPWHQVTRSECFESLVRGSLWEAMQNLGYDPEYTNHSCWIKLSHPGLMDEWERVFKNGIRTGYSVRRRQREMGIL